MAGGLLSESTIKVRQKISAKKAVMLVGLPGVGFVSKLAVDSIAKQLNPTLFATLYSPHFPNQVLALPNGCLRPFTLKMYYARVGETNLVLVRGGLQPLTVEGQYEVCGKLLDFFAGLGGAQVIAMAGYSSAKKTGKPRVYCAATTRKTLEEFTRLGALTPSAAVPIVGMAGLVPALAPLYGLKGACLLAETSGAVLDAGAAAALIEIAGKKLKQKFDLKSLQSQARQAQKIVEQLEAQARDEAARAGAALAATEAQKRDNLSYIR
ncbi:MAG: PAC2 family protein [Candidatus Micrarchaeia archaeon]|jgi:uncharacterized protein (TIGR00162 family)